MRRAVSRLVLLLALCMDIGAAVEAAGLGRDGNPVNWCRNGLFPGDEDFRLARVIGEKGAKVHFQSDDEGCPDVARAACGRKSYLLPGDRLLVSRGYGDFVCGWYQPAKGAETVSWLPRENVQISASDARPGAVAWIGEWRYYDNSISIAADAGGSIKVSGEAFWNGGRDNIHEGSMSGNARPRGNRLEIAEGECKVWLTLVGDYLIARDNSACGGANVRFDGVYVRKPVVNRGAR